MSKFLVQIYHYQVKTIIQNNSSHQEQFLRLAFQKLLEDACASRQLVLMSKLAYRSRENLLICPNGTIKDALRLSWGYWESEGLESDLNQEVEAKLAKGYPSENILFENSKTAILIQAGQEAQRAEMADVAQLDTLLTRFINYQPPWVKEFWQVIEQFQADLPIVVQTLRTILVQQGKENKQFQVAFKDLLACCQMSIKKITPLEIREMIIQHLLAKDIFLAVFNDSEFYRQNVVAGQLETVVNSFLTSPLRDNTLKSLENYYAVIRQEAASIANHHELLKFIKAIYEHFYQTYPGADKLEVVYTPHEIVRFMIESTDYLLAKHFNRHLADKQVEILDPATGTGTFITELIDYLPTNQLRDKYLREIHGNEVAILPYCLTNLTIEASYRQKMGESKAFSHLCWVDTLDNLGFKPGYQNQQQSLFFGLANEENAARIQAQNQQPISVIIGNPPDNASWQNENKSRDYPEIDTALKQVYFAGRKKRKIKPDEMYLRFFRWASDRLLEDGILALVTDNSFLKASRFEGFRKAIAEEFSEIYVVDLGGKERKNQKADNNVFGTQTGVAISFLVKRQAATSCQIYYTHRPARETAANKLSWLADHLFEDMDFIKVLPTEDHNWFELIDDDEDEDDDEF